MLIKLWLPCTKALLLMLYKQSTAKKVMIKNLRNKLNALNISQFVYYSPACGNYICWSIGENFLQVV